MQIPTVTLQDLQAFQAQHFPGAPNTIAPVSQSTTDYGETEDEEEEDLGYYPDGIKRTLTDEQVQIFRHSEIHALLRARQLEQDDVEYEARRKLSEAADSSVNANLPAPAEHTSEGRKNTRIADMGAVRHAMNKPNSSSEQETQAAASEALVYEDEKSHTQSSVGNDQAKPQNLKNHRRIISYED